MSTFKFVLSSAITAIPEDGHYDAEAHFVATKPLRRLLINERVERCFVSRYGVSMTGPDLDASQTLERVQTAVREVASLPGLFPFLKETGRDPGVMPDSGLPEKRHGFAFNTAVLPWIGKRGEFNEDAFRLEVMLIRAKLMELDGACGCRIARYGVTVDAVQEVASPETVMEHVTRTMGWAAQRAPFFPGVRAMRGRKQLVVTRDDAQRVSRCEIAFDVPVLSKADISTDKEWGSFVKRCRPMQTRIMGIDGVASYRLWLTGMEVEFIPEAITREQLVAALSEVIVAATHSTNLFPGAKGARRTERAAPVTLVK